MSIIQNVKETLNLVRTASNILTGTQQAAIVDSESRPVNREAHTDSRTSNSPYKEARKHQIYRDHAARICKLSSNEAIPARTRIEKLNQMSRQYATGYPFKNNQVLMNLNIDSVPLLSRLASGAADQLLAIEKIKAGKGRSTDFGMVDA